MTGEQPEPGADAVMARIRGLPVDDARTILTAIATVNPGLVESFLDAIDQLDQPGGHQLAST